MSLSRRVKVGVVQLNCTEDKEQNLARVETFIRAAAKEGSDIVVTPENTNFISSLDKKVSASEDYQGPTVTLFKKLARELRVYLLLGSFNERVDSSKCYNTSLLFSPEGTIVAKYRKLHLFDVTLPRGEVFKESDFVKRGSEVVVADLPWGKVGLTICYDLRFPELYRLLAKKGTEVIFVPSAFTFTTGRDHWLPLLQARAIENLVYIVAPAQWGKHDKEGKRESWGRSAVIDPWGIPLAVLPDGEGYTVVDLWLERVSVLRRSIPVLQNSRFDIKEVEYG